LKLDDLISILVFLLFCGVTYIGIQNHQEKVNDRIQMNQEQRDMEDREAQEQRDMENRRKQEIEDAYFEALKYKDNVAHDSDPETKTYPIKLEAINVFDAENDSIGYLWTKLEGEDVDLSSTSEKITYFLAKAGNYKFQLTVTDIYGAKSDTTKIIEIKDEPNTAPVATFSISNELKPIFYPNGPKWQNVADSVKAFQTRHKLKVDGLWGPASNKQFLKLAKDKKDRRDKVKADKKAKANKDKAKKDKADKDKADKAKAMKIYNDKLAKIESDLQNVSGFFWAAGKRTTLEAEKAAHIKTKPK